MPISGALWRAGKVGHYIDARGPVEGTELRAAVVAQFSLRRFHPWTQYDTCWTSPVSTASTLPNIQNGWVPKYAITVSNLVR